jgi:hypothetical protein
MIVRNKPEGLHEALHLEENKRVKWRVIQAIWPNEGAQQDITWTFLMRKTDSA